MDCALSDFHRELISLVDHTKTAVAVPRNHAKTTIIGFFYALYCLCEQEHKQTVLLGSTQSRADETMAKIRTELETNESLREMYGDLVSKELWTNSGLVLKNGTCIVSRGYGQSFRGINRKGRPSLLIADDLENDEMVLSEDRRKKFQDWWFSVVRPALSHPDKAQVFIIGTLLHQQAFLTRMVHGEWPDYKTVLYRAIQEDGTPLWPERFTIETLLAEKQAMGDIYFAHEYQNEPIADSDRMFHEEWIRRFETKDVPPGSAVFITVDPALDQKSSADYTAIIVTAVDSHKNMYVLEATKRRMLPKEIIETVYNKAIAYKARAVGIEEAAYQKTLIYDMKDHCKKNGKYIRVVPLKHENRKKELRIKSLQPKLQNGEMFFRPVGQEELIREIILYTNAGAGTKHDDLIDALAYQIQLIGPGREIKEKEVLPFNSYEAVKRRSKQNSSKLRKLGRGVSRLQPWRRNRFSASLRHKQA